MNDDNLIQALLASPVVVALLHWLSKRRPRNITEGLEQAAHAYQILARLLTRSGVLCCWVETLENGGGIPTASNPAYSTATCLVSRTAMQPWVRQMLSGPALTEQVAAAVRQGSHEAPGILVPDLLLRAALENAQGAWTRRVLLQAARTKVILVGVVTEMPLEREDHEALMDLRALMGVKDKK